MQKFSIFTVILASVLVVVVAEFAINNYGQSGDGIQNESELTFNLPGYLDLSKVLETDVLGSDEFGFAVDDDSGQVDPDLLALAEEEFGSSTGIVYDEIPFGDAPSSDLADFEDDTYEIPSVSSVYLREDQVLSAGFANAKIQEESHDGLLFKSVYIDDLYDVEVMKWAIRNDSQLLAKVYAFSFGPDSGVSEVYEILKIRSSQGLNAEVNETNDLGGASFYMNDSRRQNTAFLTVKIGSLIYAFSYPKDYHQQVKNLVTLLDLEF